MDFEEIQKFIDSTVFTQTKKHLKDIEFIVLQGSWQGQKYEEIAELKGYTAKYLRQDIGPKLWKLLSEVFGEKVSKTNFRTALERHWRTYGENESDNLALTKLEEIRVNPHGQNDWGEAPDTNLFYGRQRELATIREWVISANCRLITILGIGGVGKTALSAKLAEQIQTEFDYLLWRSLRNAPSIQDLLTEIILFLSNQQQLKQTNEIHAQISHVINLLRSSRCLLVLDNIESILQGGERVGRYRKGYEEYDQLLHRLGDEPHQSCVILTSREKPCSITELESSIGSVRSHQLQGVQSATGTAILAAKGIANLNNESQKLVKRYSGNPLALKLVASTIQSMFSGNITCFLQQDTVAFGGVWDLLEQQFTRLSSIEQQIMYWLAINREWVTLSELHEDIFPQVTQRQLLEAVQSLKERSLIETNAGGITQQPVVMEYITERFIQNCLQEILTRQIHLFNTHALIKAQTKDYIRDTQIRLILQPLLEQLLNKLGNKRRVEDYLNIILTNLQKNSLSSQGYSAGNLLNLFWQLNTDLTGYDFSSLKIWQAYLPQATLHQTNFSHTNISKSVFAEIFGGIISVTYSHDGKLLATGDTLGNIYIWEIALGKKLIAIQEHQTWVWSVVFSSDDKLLASASGDALVKLWDVKTGQCQQTFRGHSYGVTAVVFRLDRQQLISSSLDKTLKLWDIATGQCLHTLESHSSGIWSLTISQDGQTVASSADDNTIKLWDIDTGKCQQTWQEHKDWVRCVAFSFNEQFLASGSLDSTIKIWHTSTEECLQTFSEHTKGIHSLAFSPDSCWLVSGSNDQTLRLWNIKTGKCTKTLQGHISRVNAVAFSPDSQQLASSGDDHTIKLWDRDTDTCIRTFSGHRNSIWSVIFSPDGQTLASCSFDQTIKLWEINTGKCRQNFEGHQGIVTSITFSQDGRHLFSSSFDQTIKQWDVSTGKCLKTWSEHQGIVSSIVLDSNTTNNITPRLFSCSFDETIKIWDLSTDKSLTTLRAPRPYEGMNINGINGLNESQKATLQALGALIK